MTKRSRLTAFLLAGLAALGAAPTALHAAATGKSFPTAVKRNLDEEARLIVNLLQNYHYSGRDFGDIENNEMIDRFLKELDSDQLVLSKADIDAMHRRFGQTLKTVYIYKGDMQPAQEIYALLVSRARRRFDWIEKRLTGPFDLSDGRTVGADDLKPSADAESEDRRWEWRLTNELIESMLAGRDDAASRDYLTRHYRKVAGYGAGFDPYEVRAMFLDSVIRSFDSRSGYFSADSSREFALEMAGAVTGIGIEVRREAGRCTVDSIDPGGPADLGSDLQPGNELIEITNEGEAPAPVSGMRLREVTDKLRGTLGTSVALTYRRDGSEELEHVTIARSRVTLIQNRAHGAVHLLPAAGGVPRRIGVIDFPSFYSSEDGQSSVASDVAELLDKLTASGIAGLVIDIRGNPGGNMEEAVQLCGEFIHSGFAAHSRTQDGVTTSYPIVPAGHVYDGPLIVLTSPESASASELFSGAIQTLHRGLVMGGESTIGKGTVQRYIPLEQMQNQGPQRDWGTLRLTYAMFNLPDGRPIQQHGVASDLVLPMNIDKDIKREIDLEHSLTPAPIDVAAPEVPPAGMRIPADSGLALSLKEKVRGDLEELPEWQLWRDELKYWADPDVDTPLSLSLEVRRKQWAEWTAKAEELVNRRRELLASATYEIEPVDLPSTVEAFRAHDERLRALIGDRSPQPLVRLEKGGIIVATPHGHLRRLRWSSFNIGRWTCLAGELAEAFNRGAGTQIGRDDMGVILAELNLLEHANDSTAREVFKRHMPEGTSTGAVEAGINAVLAQVLEFNPDLRAERWSLDIPLREAVRTVGAWADAPSGGDATGTPTPAP